LKKTSSCLGEWRDTSIARESASSFFERELKKGLADPPAYASFQDELRRREGKLLAAYQRSKKPLRESLEQLVMGFKNRQEAAVSKIALRSAGVLPNDA
jgi:hypothetical protein